MFKSTIESFLELCDSLRSFSLEEIANVGSILTLSIAVYWFFKTREKEYFSLQVPGNYKIFSGLRGQETSTALHDMKITSITSSGWFFGNFNYSEVFEHPLARSAGTSNFIGKINYSYTRLCLGWIWRLIRFKSFHPMEESTFASFHGKIYFMSRNDFDVSTTSWKKFVTEEYSIIHFRNAYRFKLFNQVNGDSSLQLLPELSLVNTDKVPDEMFNIK
jgi:hypothetical protein